MSEESGKITIEKVATQALWNVYNLINNRVNVPDPNDSTGNRKFVYTSKPDFSGRNFAGFPFIIVRSAKPKKAKSTADLSKSFRDYDILIEVYAQDSLGSDSTANKIGIATRDSIVNKVIKTLESPTNRKVLITYGQAHLNYSVDIDDDAELDGKPVFSAEFDINFANNLSSSS